MKFVCLGFIDESKWEQLTPEEGQQMMDSCFKYDDELRRNGHFLGGEALASARQAVTLRGRNGQVEVTDGPFTETKEVLGGILLLEARDRDHAVALMKQHPGVQAGPFEIRPADEDINQLIQERDAAFQRTAPAPAADTAGQNSLASADTVQQSTAEDEARIRELLAGWSKALEARDVAGLTADYHPDAVVYDAIPPYKTVGVDNIRQVWNQCLPHFPENFRSEHADLNIQIDGNLAMVHGLHHFVPTPADHPCGHTWMRVTICYRKVAGQWKVIHEHVSVPFDPLTNQAWTISDPDSLTAPDYGQPQHASSK